VTLADLLFAPGTDAEGAAPVVYAGTDGAEAHTWDEVRARADAVAAALAAAGVERGQAVGVMLPNGAELVATLFGVWRAGGVYVPLNPRLTDDEVAHILGSVDPAVIVTTGDHRSRVADRPVLVPRRGAGVGPGG
jgi:acyl-CoA synthetase (AMP-forming)/AMP-acid ligase II